MKRRTGIRLAGLAALLAVVALAGWSLRSPQHSAIAPSEDAEVPGSDSTLLAAGREIETPRARPLPPPDAPLAQILPELVERADAGDRKAACRLGMELIRCVNLADLASLARPEPDQDQAETKEQPTAAYLEYQDRARLWKLERRIQCDGVPPSLRNRGSHYLRQAAHAGEPEAMVRYAEGHHWPPSGRGVAADPDFDAWRRDAAAMMHRALEAGAPEAAYLLHLNYSDDFGWLSALIPDDPEQAVAMHLLTNRLFGTRELPQLSQNLSAGAVQRARERAQEMHARYFQNRRFPPDRHMLSTVFYPPSSNDRASFCAD